MRISDWSSDVCSSDLRLVRSGSFIIMDGAHIRAALSSISHMDDAIGEESSMDERGTHQDHLALIVYSHTKETQSSGYPPKPFAAPPLLLRPDRKAQKQQRRPVSIGRAQCRERAC